MRHDKSSCIRAKLIELLRSGEWASGSKLPGGRILAKRMGCVPVTLEGVLRDLSAAGYLVRREREGTFVASRDTWGTASLESRGHFVGVIGGGFNSMLSEVGSTLREHNYEMVVRDVGDSIGEALKAIEDFVKLGVRGIIWSPLSTANHRADNTRLATLIIDSQLPAVAVDRYPEDVEVNCVTSDNARSGYALTRHLLELGHRRIGLIRHLHGSTPEDRHKGYTRAVMEFKAEADPELVVSVEHGINPEELVKLLREWLRCAQPTAVWSISGDLGAAALVAAQAEGLKIPDDVSLATFDGIPAPFPVTSIIQPFDEIGRRAAEFLVEEMARSIGEVRRIVLKSHFRLGASTGAPVENSKIEARNTKQ